MESKEVSWIWLTVDTMLAPGECELIYAYVVPSAADADVTFYSGENTTGQQVVQIKEAAISGHAFWPAVPVYCRKGLYVDVGSNVTGVLVVWRGL